MASSDSYGPAGYHDVHHDMHHDLHEDDPNDLSHYPDDVDSHVDSEWQNGHGHDDGYDDGYDDGHGHDHNHNHDHGHGAFDDPDHASTTPVTVDGGPTHPEGGSAEMGGGAGEVQMSRRDPSRRKICTRCDLPLSGQFVRALGGTFHLECFRCQDCGEIVASKFFPAEGGDGSQYPLCERDYFARLGLLCHTCKGALRGSYITALERKYHVNHFTCSVCPTEFGAQDSYYEHEGQVYCHFHYSTEFAQRCNGCRTAILKQFVEILRNGQNQHWHPECYMIHKFWNVRLAQDDAPSLLEQHATDHQLIKDEENKMEFKVYKIWSVLSALEESSAACISDMLLHVSNGAYLEGILVAQRFIFHVEVLFRAADNLDAVAARAGGTQSRSLYPNGGASAPAHESGVANVHHSSPALSYDREAKLLCKKIVAFFSLVSRTHENGVSKLGVTQDLLSLVTGLAHYLKLLIRICLQGALRVERESKSTDGIYGFLSDLERLEEIRGDFDAPALLAESKRFATKDSDLCVACAKPLEDECAKLHDLRWHVPCLKCVVCSRGLGRNVPDAHYSKLDRKVYCSKCVPVPDDGDAADSAPVSSDVANGGSTPPPFEHVTKLQQYVFLLRVAMARLLERLQRHGFISPSALDDASADGRRGFGNSGGVTRSQSYSNSDRHRRESSYESTRDEVAKLRNTRLDRSLSSSVRKARMSRIMDRPEGRSARPGSAGADDGGRGNNSLQIVEDRDTSTTDMMFGHQEGLTLDDIPRIVAAEQVREQYNMNSNNRSLEKRPSSAGRIEGGMGGGGGGGAHLGPRMSNRRFFSELSSLEYFAVRHLAVLSMHPMVENEFSQEELLSFIEQKKQATFWKNLGKAFGKNEKKVAVKKKGVFGVPLEMILERDGADSSEGVGPGALRIPAIVDNIISAMKQMDLSVEGVFRKNGNIKKQIEMVEKIDREGCDNVNFMDQPVVQIAALLKRYLRELPDPLMTHKLYRLWVAAAKIPDEDRRRECLHLTCCLLPKCHRDSLEVLFRFLKWAGTFHQVDEDTGSRMDVKNLATVIAPNILYNPAKATALDTEPLWAIDAVECMINYIEEMCMIPACLDSILGDPLLFSSGDLSTKDLLKRFHELQGQGPPQGPGGGETFTGRQDGSTRPPARRVETDPALWQGESSVRPVIQDTTPAATPGPVASAIAPPPPAPPAPPAPPVMTPPQAYQAYTPYNPYAANTAASGLGSSSGPHPPRRERPGGSQPPQGGPHESQAAPQQPEAAHPAEPNQRREWRNSSNSNWSRQNGNGLGVTGQF